MKKTCRHCKKEKDISKFYVDSEQPDKCCVVCKLCLKKEGCRKEPQQRNVYKEEPVVKSFTFNEKARVFNPYRYFARQTIQNHKKDCTVLVTIEDIEDMARETQTCRYCGVDLNWENRGKGFDGNVPSLDRIENEKILTGGNIAIICRRCNIMKSDTPHTKFVQFCHKIAEKFSS